MEQIILKSDNNYKELENYLVNNNYKKLFIVCGNSIKKHNIYNFFKSIKNIEIVFFTDFTANPKYEEVCKGVEIYKNEVCDLIVALGGGSSIDVAKCIKLFTNMDSSTNFLKQEIVENNIPILAIPTTAGTGSEATKFAVIYYNGEKQSVTHESSIPGVVLFDESLLNTLPTYQRKATVLDAFCHGIESMWSINSTDESKKYSKDAIKMIMGNMDSYFEGKNEPNYNMLMASNLAGKAINITQTTAGHAMCYKLTSLYGISHGHAAALVNSELFPYMIENIDKCSDSRGQEYLENVFKELAKLFGYKDLNESKEYSRELLAKLDLYNVDVNYNDLDTLVKSVNVQRLKNNPVSLNEEDIRTIYKRIFERIEKNKTR